jgi:hypothetical protein
MKQIVHKLKEFCVDGIGRGQAGKPRVTAPFIWEARESPMEFRKQSTLSGSWIANDQEHLSLGPVDRGQEGIEFVLAADKWLQPLILP